MGPQLGITYNHLPGMPSHPGKHRVEVGVRLSASRLTQGANQTVPALSNHNAYSSLRALGDATEAGTEFFRMFCSFMFEIGSQVVRENMASE